MRFLRGKADSTPVGEFWEWWTETGIHQIEGPMFTSDPGVATAELSKRILELNPALAWSIGGRDGQRVLVISSAGDPEATLVAEDLRLTAPAIAGWALQIGRGPEPEAARSIVQVVGHRVDLSLIEVTFAPDPARARLSVTLFHPEFRTYPERLALEAAFHKLDFELGENAVTRWIGQVDIARVRPERSETFDGLRAAIAEISEPEPTTWSIASIALSNGTNVVGRVRRTLRWQDHPFHTRHYVLRVRFRGRGDGLPTNEEYERLVAIDDVLEELAGAAEEVLYLTGAGERVIHFYAREDDAAAASALKAAAREHGYRLRSERDPGWTAVRDFL